MLENYGGNLPLWLSPTQVVLATITDEAKAYADDIENKLLELGVRVISDKRNEQISYKVREHSKSKSSIILALGKKEVECPGPGNLRVGDLTISGDEKVTGHELSADGQTCITLYEPTTVAEKFLPSVNQASTTLAIAVIATAGAAATPLILRLIKPAVKKAITTLQKKVGKHRELSRSEIMTNKYREKKGLPPLKVKKKKS